MKYLYLIPLFILLSGCGPQEPDPGLVALPALPPEHAAIYQQYCGRCHARDVPGTPQTGRPSDWRVRVNKGVEQLTLNAMRGYGGMPPMGMCTQCSESDIRAMVEYMLTGVDRAKAP